MPDTNFVVFLNGGYGVGKSSTLDHIGDVFAETERAFSLMDVDWFHRSWPPAVEDPENTLVEAANLALVWSNYLSAGPRQLVVAGVIASDRDRDRYATAFSLPVRSVRLTASERATEDRLRRRYTEHQTRSLAWHLQRQSDLTQSQSLGNLDELVIDTTDLRPREVAEAVLHHFDLL